MGSIHKKQVALTFLSRFNSRLELFIHPLLLLFIIGLGRDMSGLEEVETVSFHPDPHPYRTSFHACYFLYFQHRFPDAAGWRLNEVFFDAAGIGLQLTFISAVVVV